MSAALSSYNGCLLATPTRFIQAKMSSLHARIWVPKHNASIRYHIESCCKHKHLGMGLSSMQIFCSHDYIEWIFKPSVFNGFFDDVFGSCRYNSDWNLMIWKCADGFSGSFTQLVEPTLEFLMDLLFPRSQSPKLFGVAWPTENFGNCLFIFHILDSLQCEAKRWRFEFFLG